MIIRAATMDDAQGMRDILNPIIEMRCYSSLDTTLSLEDEMKFISDFPERGIFHVAERGGEIIGFQTVGPLATYTHAHDHVGVIGTMVKLSERRQGIGGALLKTTEEVAIEKGYEKLFTSVRADNLGGRQFYTKSGFEIIGQARDHVKIDGNYNDSMIIEKFLKH